MRRAEKGFTLLEVLVAALLLGMLVTILTMVFNQSSVAWRTGTAGVADLDEKRQNISLWHEAADSALPHVDGNKKFLVLSAWDIMHGGAVRSRSVAERKSEDGEVGVDFERPDNWFRLTVQGSSQAGRMKSFVVGVTSAGPDGKFNTGDDITTWPKDVQK